MTAKHRLAVALVILAMIASLLAAEWQEADTAHFRFLFEPRDRPYVDQFSRSARTCTPR